MHTRLSRLRQFNSALLAVALFASVFVPMAAVPAVSANERSVMALETVNVRSGPSSADPILAELYAGEWVTTTGESVNGFVEIYWGDWYAYVYADFLDLDGSGTPAPESASTPAESTSSDGETVWVGAGTLYTSDSVNLRSGPGTGDSAIVVLPAGSSVYHTGALNNGFAQVDTDYGSGWVHYDYLAANAPTQTATAAPAAPEVTSQGQQIVNFAMQFHGYPYVWAGNTPSGFDCSGFTQYVVSNTLGYDITHSTDLQAGYGTPVGWGEWQVGDLVFFSGTGASGYYSHVGIYIGDGQFIHAENPGTGVVISSLYSSYYSAHYAYAVRL